MRPAWRGTPQRIDMELDMIDTRLPRFKIAANIFDAVSIDDVNKTAQFDFFLIDRENRIKADYVSKEAKK